MNNQFSGDSGDFTKAEQIAVRALAYLSGQPAELERFLALSGLTPETIRSAARAPGFLRGVLDHFAGDEPLLLAFAADCGIEPQGIAAALAVLGKTERAA